MNDAGILHGEEALGHDDIKDDGENEGGDGDDQRGELMFQNPLQRASVKINDALKGALGHFVETACFALRDRASAGGSTSSASA